jgi:hypothetical protein
MTDHIELSATVPDEPPDGSVILDRARRAWQRRGSAWYMAGALPSLFVAAGAAKWPWLLLDCGPVVPLWTPPSVGAEADAAATAVAAGHTAPPPWNCPNTPPCEHPSLVHDVSGDPEDPKPMCCADGCRCGQPDPGPDEVAELHAAAGYPDAADEARDLDSEFEADRA